MIRKYLNGELDARTMHQLERQAQDDPMLMDMLMGMEMTEEEESAAQISAISELIKKRVHQEKAVPLFPWRRLMVAASIVFVFSIAVLLLRKPEKNDGADQAGIVLKKSLPANKLDTVKPALLPDAGLVAVQPVKQKKSAIYRKPVTAIDGQSDKVTKVQTALDSVIYKGDALAEVALSSTTIAPSANEVMPALAGKVAGLNASAKTRKETTDQPLSGVIKDEESGLPLPGALVRLKGENQGVSTDAKGRFVLSSGVKGATLDVFMIGYDRQQIKVVEGQDVAISLKPTSTALSEVVVVTSDTQRSIKKMKAEPLIGWKAYDEYLKKQARSDNSITGSVTLAFTLDASGTPQEIRIVKSVNSTLNRKATELIAGGSKWLNGKDKEEIKIRIRFR